MDKTKRYLSVAFVAVLAIVIVVSLIGMILLKKKPVILQGADRGNGNTYLR